MQIDTGNTKIHTIISGDLLSEIMTPLSEIMTPLPALTHKEKMTNTVHQLDRDPATPPPADGLCSQHIEGAGKTTIT